MAAAEADHHGDHGGSHEQSHFLVVASGLQGHLNPARALARRLALAPGAARVTLSVTAAAHGRLFPSSTSDEASDGIIYYIPFSDGFAFGTWPRTAAERAQCRRASAESLASVARRLAAAGRPVTCVVSTISLPAIDAALELGIPFAFYWIQSATSFAAYHHYLFHGHEALVAALVGDPAREVSLPGLPPLRIRDLPSFLVDPTGSEQAKAIIDWLRAIFEHIDREKPKVLVNTLDMLEPTALQAVRQHFDAIAVGPMVNPPCLQQTDAIEEDRRVHLYNEDEKDYMEWLGAQAERSVVYVSYGSILTFDRQQVEELMQGLREFGRPFLWVVRKDGLEEEVERILSENYCGLDQRQGLIVEWCDQLAVLSHSSVGCFVTHCGWNSTLEAVALGVPVVAVPNWSDQLLNAHLVEEWGTGVRAKRGDKGLLVGTELAKCLEMVMDGGDKARSLREKASALKDSVQKDVIEGGLVESSLKKFVMATQKSESSV